MSWASVGSAAAKTEKVAPVGFPRVQEIRGQVEQLETRITVVNREPQYSEVPRSLKKGQRLQVKSHLRVGGQAQLRLALSESSELILLENSDVLLPDISYEDGAVKEIQLLSGGLRYRCQADCDRKVSSAIFEVSPGAGDFIFNYNALIPEIQISVLAGEVDFGGLENETQVRLKENQGASFRGELDEGKPAFDVLLKGRRIAKGQLSEVIAVPADLRQKLQKEDQEYAKKLKIPSKPLRRASQICDKPYGEFNQCAWVCEKNKKGAKDCRVTAGAQCVRLRCNANGAWSDRTELPATKSICRAQDWVAECDY
jgi:hypothetical protein